MKFSLFSFLIFGLVIFSSCDKENEATSDDALIQAIIEATNKTEVDAASLPASASNLLTQDYSESYIEVAMHAPELGYEVSMRRGVGSRIGERNEVYFDRDGRELRRQRDRERRRGDGGSDREECFELVFPVTFVMPDGTEISGDAGELRLAIGEWYENNSGEEEAPQLQYPVDVLFEDGTTQTVNSDEELRMAYGECD